MMTFRIIALFFIMNKIPNVAVASNSKTQLELFLISTCQQILSSRGCHWTPIKICSGGLVSSSLHFLSQGHS